MERIKILGDILTKALPLALALTIILQRDWRSLFYFGIVYGAGMLLTQIIKGIFDAPRPRESKEHVIYVRGYSHKDGESCISSHAMSACLPAFYLLFTGPIYLFIIYFILSSVCAWTRVKVKAHWPLDVILPNIIAFNLNLLLFYLLRF
jgi:membrane-associated phospholipid phosphatase